MKKILLALFALPVFAGAACAASDSTPTLDLVSGYSVNAASAYDLGLVRENSAKGFTAVSGERSGNQQYGGNPPPPPPSPAGGDRPSGGHNDGGHNGGNNPPPSGHNPPPNHGGHNDPPPPHNGGHGTVDHHNDHQNDHHDATVGNAAVGGIWLLANLLPLCPDNATTWACVIGIVALIVVLIIW